MKRITKQQLFALIADIDYVMNGTFPVRFSVENNSEERFYEAGIGDLHAMSDEVDDEEVEREQQYLAHVDTFDEYNEGIYDILDVQEPDTMVFKKICEMVERECGILHDSKIILYDEISFSGEQEYLLANKEWLIDEMGYEIE